MAVRRSLGRYGNTRVQFPPRPLRRIMYELTDVKDIRSIRVYEDYIITLVTFSDGRQYCSCCTEASVDYFPECDESIYIWEGEGGFNA